MLKRRAAPESRASCSTAAILRASSIGSWPDPREAEAASRAGYSRSAAAPPQRLLRRMEKKAGSGHAVLDGDFVDPRQFVLGERLSTIARPSPTGVDEDGDRVAVLTIRHDRFQRGGLRNRLAVGRAIQMKGQRFLRHRPRVIEVAGPQ